MSPDLNIIEHVWEELEMPVSADGKALNYYNKDTL